MAITYSYENRHISHFTFKKVEGSCKRDSSHTVLIGVFCKNCPFYEGMKTDLDSGHKFVICSSDFHKKDDEGASRIRRELFEEIENNALCALDY